VATISTKTSHPKTNNLDRGFTLIEILIVIGLIAAIFLLGLPKIGGLFRMNLNKASREIASVVRESYNSSLMSGKAYRIVWDLKARTYWAEAGPRNLLLDTEESKEKEKQRARYRKKGEVEEQGPAFSMDKTVTRKKKSLPSGIAFHQIFTDQGKDPIIEGTAYTHIFPHGVTERTIIQLTDDQKAEMSLVLSAVLGTTHLERRFMTMKEGYEEP